MLFLLSSIALTISPGPDIVYVLTQSIANGKQRGIAIALGLVSGIIIHTSLVAFGVAFLISQHEFLLHLIKLFGSTYLLYLAYQVYKSEPLNTIDESMKSKKSFISAFKKGFIMNVLNPKVTLFFLAFLPTFIPKNSSNIIFETYQLGFIFMLQALVIFVLVSLLADKLSYKIRNNLVFNHIMKWVQIIVFVCLALFLWMS